MKLYMSFIIMLPLLLGGLSGCVTGASSSYDVTIDPNSGIWSLHYTNAGKDIQANGIDLAGPGGFKMSIAGVNSQDKLGQLQLQLLLAQTQATRQIIESILPLIGGIVGGKVPTVSSAGVAPISSGPDPTTQPAAGLSSATRAELVGRIDACPFMSADEKAAAEALLSKLP